MSETTIVDINIPNAGRVYDYVLGGSHNFESDRQAGEYMISLVPSTRKWVRMLRMFLNEATHRLSEEGFERFLDFASGLPTADHIHQLLPNASVVYTDSDPVTVVYSQELVKDNEKVRYLDGDIRNIAAILNSPTVKEFFGEDNENIANSLASQAAVAIKNADLLKEITTLLFSVVKMSTYLIFARSLL